MYLIFYPTPKLSEMLKVSPICQYIDLIILQDVQSYMIPRLLDDFIT